MTMDLTANRTIIDKMNNRGYWRVLIRSTKYNKENIPTLTECERYIYEGKISLRGWDYPHINRDNLQRKKTWIECYGDFMGHIEYWRFYQSGQFAHRFSYIEDATIEEIGEIYSPALSKGKTLSLLNALYRWTEIYLLAVYFIRKKIIYPQIQIYISLNNTKDRALVTDSNLFVDPSYICQRKKLEFEDQFPIQNLLANYEEIALDKFIALLQGFNWPNPPRSLLREEQQKFIERR